MRLLSCLMTPLPRHNYVNTYLMLLGTTSNMQVMLIFSIEVVEQLNKIIEYIVIILFMYNSMALLAAAIGKETFTFATRDSSGQRQLED